MGNAAPGGDLDANPPNPDGSDRVTLEIQGKGPFSRLKYERGFHSTQRVMDGELDELVDALVSHAPDPTARVAHRVDTALPAPETRGDERDGQPRPENVHKKPTLPSEYDIK